jgi:hypothetical protein
MSATLVPDAELVRLRRIEAAAFEFAASWGCDVGEIVDAAEVLVEALAANQPPESKDSHSPG